MGTFESAACAFGAVGVASAGPRAERGFVVVACRSFGSLGSGESVLCPVEVCFEESLIGVGGAGELCEELASFGRELGGGCRDEPRETPGSDITYPTYQTEDRTAA